MGLDVILEGENHIEAGQRPSHSSDCKRTKIDESRKDYHLRKLDGDSRELKLSKCSSPHRKSMPARTHVVYSKDDDVLKRGSVYQSSGEVRRMRQVREGRGAAESDLKDEAFISFEIVDSSPQPLASEAILPPKQNRSPLAFNMESTSQSVANAVSVPRKSTDLAPQEYLDFPELSFRDLPEDCLKLGSPCLDLAPQRDSLKDNLVDICLHTNELGGKGSIGTQKTLRKEKVCRKAEANNVLSERETVYNLSKSFSARTVMLNSPSQSERETLKASQKSRFSPFKKMLDPIMKSKSQQNPSLIETQTVRNNVTDPSNTSGHRILRKSLLNDFSKATQKVDNDSESIGRDQVALTVSSPAHLHATLKLESKHGAPAYEFSVDDPEDILSAKTWRSDSAFNWVYTFHSSKKKTSISGRGSKERHGQSSPIIGQMQVSCYLCSEVNDTGALDNSTVTEFILYDIAQARRRFAVEKEPNCPSDSTRPATCTIADSLTMESHFPANSPVEPEKSQHRFRRPSGDSDYDPSTSYPWAPADLHPHLEIAAIVTRIPFNKKGTKGRQVGEEIKGKEQESLLCSSAQETDTIGDCMSPAHLKVVTPSGTHGLPSTEESGPSSLLDRWRFGGACDCGGWDMACPIVVFENPYANDAADDSAMQSQQTIVLFVQGSKEKVPALSIMVDGKGQYLVNFHAQLSALQAFSICIAILHSSEAASAHGQDNRHSLFSNSLKMLLEEEVRHLIEAVEEKKRKAKKKVEQIPLSFVLDHPPFSPMGRV